MDRALLLISNPEKPDSATTKDVADRRGFVGAGWDFPKPIASAIDARLALMTASQPVA